MGAPPLPTLLQKQMKYSVESPCMHQQENIANAMSLLSFSLLKQKLFSGFYQRGLGAHLLCVDYCLLAMYLTVCALD